MYLTSAERRLNGEEDERLFRNSSLAGLSMVRSPPIAPQTLLDSRPRHARLYHQIPYKVKRLTARYELAHTVSESSYELAQRHTVMVYVQEV